MTDKGIHKTCIVSCSVARVWRKWTTHEGLKTFFGSDNKIELKPDGAFEIYFVMDKPYGMRGSEGCKIVTYCHKKMLMFTWNAPPQFEQIRKSNVYTWVIVSFYDQENGKTKVDLQHHGWHEGEQWQEVYDYFDKAWEQVLNRLVKSCEA
jgi:uncharacterized protein YndB with AHSA1/START domain